MYSVILLVHSWLRWLVVLAALLTLSRAFAGRAGHKLWSRTDDRSFQLFTISLDVQFVFGLILYVGISPITAVAFQNLSAAMRDPSLRFFVVEHAIGMIAAVALAHVGRVKVRKAASAEAKHRAALLFVALALIAILMSIPWPWMPGGRPLFRL
jgi:hypothetical protein